MHMKALRTAMQKLEAGCRIEDAIAVCDPEVLNQLVKWKVVSHSLFHFMVMFGAA